MTEPSASDDVARVNGIYGVARCLGNVGAEGTAGLSHDPEIVVYTRTALDSLFVIATDGVWDSMTLSLVVRLCSPAACLCCATCHRFQQILARLIYSQHVSLPRKVAVCMTIPTLSKLN